MKAWFQSLAVRLPLAAAGSLLLLDLRAATADYVYDGAGRLTTALYPGGKSLRYTYDLAGNLTRREVTTGSSGGDLDGDGLPDAWEQQYFGGLGRDGTGDFDGDDFLDAAEYAAGTLPNDKTSLLEVSPDLTASGGGTTVRWPSVAGKTYRVQYKNALGDASWTDVPGDVTATGTVSTKTDPSSGGQPVRFYRIMLVP